MSIAKQMIKTISHLLPDKQYIQVAYFRKFGRFPNIKSPQTFNEKLQWLKLYDCKLEYTTMVDNEDCKNDKEPIFENRSIFDLWENTFLK